MKVERPTSDGGKIVWDSAGTVTKYDAAGNVVSTRALAPDEATRLPDWKARADAAAQASGNRVTVLAALGPHMDDLNQIIQSTGTLTAAQLSNAVRTLAQGQKRIIRLALNDFSGAN